MSRMVSGRALRSVIRQIQPCEFFEWHFYYALLKPLPVQKDLFLEAMDTAINDEENKERLTEEQFQMLYGLRQLGNGMTPEVDLDDWMDYCRLYRYTYALPVMLQSMAEVEFFSMNDLKTALAAIEEDARTNNAKYDRKAADILLRNAETILEREGI